MLRGKKLNCCGEKKNDHIKAGVSVLLNFSSQIQVHHAEHEAWLSEILKILFVKQ